MPNTETRGKLERAIRRTVSSKCSGYQLYQSAQAVITKYHWLGGLSHINQFSHTSGRWKSEVRMPAWLGSGENSLPGLQAAVCKNRSSVISNSHSSAHSMCRAAFLAPLIWGLTVWSVFPNGVREGRTQSSCVCFGVLLGRPVVLLCQEKSMLQEATGQRMRYQSTFESRHSPE